MKTALAFGTESIAIPAALAKRLVRIPVSPLPSSGTLRRKEVVERAARWGARGRGPLLVVVPDATRHIGADRLLGPLRTALKREGRRDETVSVLFACGLHAPPSPEIQAALIGSSIAGAWETSCHDARRTGRRLGTVCGVPVKVNPRVAEAGRILLLCAPAVHYLAGFSGGWKLLFPGCASEETILGLHRRTLLRGAEPGRLEANPFRRAIDLAGGLMARPVRSLHAIPGKGRGFEFMDGGTPEASLKRAVRHVRRFHTLPLPRRFDAVLASAGGAPRDIDLIQTNKAITYACRALKPGGTLVLFARCAAGSGHRRFEEALRIASLDSMRREIDRDFHPYARTAWHLRTLAGRYRIILRSDLPAPLVRRAGLQPVRTDAEAFSAIDAETSPLFLPSAGTRLPVPSS